MRNYIINDEIIENPKKFQFIRLMKYFRPFLVLLALSILLALLIDAAVLAKPYIIKLVIDNYLLKPNPNISKIIVMGVVYLIVVILGAGLAYAQTYILGYVGQKIIFNIREQVFQHIQSMSMSFFDKNSTGRILTRMTNDVEALNELFSGVLVNVFRDLIMVIGIIAVMLSMDFKLGLVSISCVPVIIGATIIYRIAARKNFMKVKGLLAKINGFLAENISGMKLVQIFHRENEKYDDLLQLDKVYFRYSLREVILNSFSKPLVDMISNLTIVILVIFCMGLAAKGQLEIGVLFAFISYIKQFFEPISEIADKYTNIQSAMISSARIFDLLDTTEFSEDLESGSPISRLLGKIEFKDVCFAYNDKDWVLKNVSFIIKPGEMAAFVGTTGSGKSTIINLMARFYEIQKGTILIDGKDIKEYRLKDLRRQIAVVLQDVFLFSTDIKSNIRLNDTNISDDDIEHAAHYVNADVFIESFSNGYNEEVKERGCTFSSGQKQLISFARAVAFNPSILVLDEATANIDTDTENIIQKAMLKISENRTSIIIAHRLSTIRNVDKIFVLSRGRIKEIGNHEELMKLNGIYSHLYSSQSAKATV